MAARRACRSLNRVQPAVTISALFVLSADRSNRATKRAQQVSRHDRGGDPPGEKAQPDHGGLQSKHWTMLPAVELLRDAVNEVPT